MKVDTIDLCFYSDNSAFLNVLTNEVRNGWDWTIDYWRYLNEYGLL